MLNHMLIAGCETAKCFSQFWKALMKIMRRVAGADLCFVAPYYNSEKNVVHTYLLNADI